MPTRPLVPLVMALWLGNVLPAMDATLIGTALPTIIGSLEGLHRYSWVFAANLLAQTTTIPIFGKLADLFGRKPVLFVGMGLFFLGTVLSAFVQNVEQLIVCRVLVGLGIASIQPMVMTIMGDALTLEQRAKIQWIFASAWFIASFVGPALASAITLYLTWRLVFAVTIPLWLGACYLLARYYHETVERKAHAIDYRGVVLLATGVLVLLFALSPGSRSGGLDLATSGGLLAVALVLLAAFVWNELRVPEPVLPPWLLLSPVIGLAALGSFTAGAVQFGASSFVPLFVQGAQGGTAAEAGAALAPMTIGWPIGAGLGGRVLLWLGYRRTILAGMVLIVVGQSGFLLLGRDTSLLLPIMSMFVVGLGFGFSTIGFLLSVQNSVSWSQRGVATASLQFFRSIGGSVGVALMGAVLSLQMQPTLAAHRLEGAGGSASALLDPVARAALPPETLAALQAALGSALHSVFFLVAGAALVGLIAGLWFPRTVSDQQEAVPVAGSAPRRAP
ncbi:MAG: MFS transporter [Chloroflexi bacterium]|nr:MFS transporter [Chloroflexota bacterium]